MSGAFLYSPGEILKKSRRVEVSKVPNDLDIILYIEYLIWALELKGVSPKLTINHDEIYVGKFTLPTQMVYVEDTRGKTLFFAEYAEEKWTIDVSSQGKWRMLLEYAFDKVRSSMSSVQRWVEEYPPIGVINGKDSRGG